MAIRNIAHSIRAGEISLGVAVGVESMSVKSVLVALWCSRHTTWRCNLIFRGSYPSRLRSPRPTPVVVDTVGANPQARDCIQVRSLEVATWMVILYDDCVLAANGMDLRNGRSNVQYLSAEARRVRAHFTHTRCKGFHLSRFVYFCSPLSKTLKDPDGNAVQALADGVFAREILPIELRGTVLSVDDTVRPNVSAEALATLKPVFPEWGGASTTAGNASGVGDGAGLCILTTRERAKAEGYDVLAKFVGTAVVGVEPRHMGIAPIYAIPKILAQTGLEKRDIDVYEVRGFCSLCKHERYARAR